MAKKESASAYIRVNTVLAKLEEAGIEAQVTGRPKQLSITEDAAAEPDVRPDPDLVAFHWSTACAVLQALGIAHANWKPGPGVSEPLALTNL